MEPSKRHSLISLLFILITVLRLKTRLPVLPKFESLLGSTSASLKIDESLAIRKMFLRVAVILRYLLTDLLQILTNWTKLALVRPCDRD